MRVVSLPSANIGDSVSGDVAAEPEGLLCNKQAYDSRRRTWMLVSGVVQRHAATTHRTLNKPWADTPPQSDRKWLHVQEGSYYISILPILLANSYRTI